MADKTYLGDGVYAAPDPAWSDAVVLTTENGLRTTNTITMEPETLTSFVLYLARRLTPGARALLAERIKAGA